ncbi:spermidine synthase [Gordonia soli]|uniref:Spermidine synthase n=1 Tax=Gordonia soli NBRC 108243 TaxID=1223545 RepID=M0QLC9_9ACTN|nr:fused MFS/spermidine synthase [Gordonia soli]GAC69455.1 hypothetical protein GS4_25_00250 [Gordonia soli NBRC 108243]
MPRQNAEPVAGTYEIDTGSCELHPDPVAGGWLLTINGAQSSHIDPDHPLDLEFEYMRQMAAVIADIFGEDARPLGTDPLDADLRVLHLGAAACALPRYLAHRFPSARQVAVEVDSALATLVRDWFDLPRAPRLRIRVGDAREVVESLTDSSRDVIVRDAFAGSFTPDHLTTTGFVRAVRRVLRSDGVYLANCGDTRDLRRVRAEAATIREVFGHLSLIADPSMLKGRRTGNVVLVGTDRAWEPSAALARTLLGDPLPSRVVSGRAAAEFASAAPILD